MAFGVGSLVARIGLHFAVSALGLVKYGPVSVFFLHFRAVLHHLIKVWFAGWLGRPIVWELRIVWWWGRWALSERTARQQG